jgi:EAL domain-containing protein (putative c-di-GMP-specific phosphodiesterase class I)
MERGDLALVYEPIVDLTAAEIVGETAVVRPGGSDDVAGDDTGKDVAATDNAATDNAATDNAATDNAATDNAPADDETRVDSVWELLDGADEAGLAAPFARWVLDTALSDFAVRIAAGGLAPDYRLWIKVSAVQVTEPGYLDSVDELTDKHGVPASALGLDIRESPGAGFPAVAAALDALSERGVVVALDELGAGPSDLDWLQQLPITGLKLAPQVVGSLEPDDGGRGRALVQGLISLGQALGFSVVAQGVTTETQVTVLQALGCELAQGPLFESADAVARLELLKQSDVEPEDVGGECGDGVVADAVAEREGGPEAKREVLWATPVDDVGASGPSPFVES